MASQNNIPTAEEIREIIGSLNRNPDREIEQILNYFEGRSHELEHLKDKNFRKVFIRRLYLHYSALSAWVKTDQEVKNLQKKKNELVEKNLVLEKVNQELEQKVKELEIKVGELDDEVQMEREEAEKALDKSREWRERQLSEINAKHRLEISELLREMASLQNNLVAKQEELDWANYLATKELPTLPKQKKQQKASKLWRFKQSVSKAKERVQQKFQTFVVQKSK